MLVYRWVQMQREASEVMQANRLEARSSTRARRRTLAAPRQLAWLLVSDPARLEEYEQHTLSFLRQHSEVNRAYEVAQQLLTMVKERNAAPLESWFLLCSNRRVSEVENFARGLQKEFSALQAALTLEFSNGPVEGQITKLKRDLAFHVWPWQFHLTSSAGLEGCLTAARQVRKSQTS
jgi:transposase